MLKRFVGPRIGAIGFVRIGAIGFVAVSVGLRRVLIVRLKNLCEVVFGTNGFVTYVMGGRVGMGETPCRVRC